MFHKKLVAVIVFAALAVSSCKMPYPGSDATPSPTKPFVKPLATNQMLDVEQKATQTAVAKMTAAAGGAGDVTPGSGTGVVPSSTPDIGGVIPTFTPPVGGPTGNAIPTSTPTPGSAGGGNIPTSTIVAITGRPASYTLQAGEFPYCIARRFNVDPLDLLALSGLSDGVVYPAGTVLKIPSSGSFPGDRALRSHPATYTVASPDETFYSIACLFGDVDPAAIAQASGLALGSALTVGQTVKIP